MNEWIYGEQFEEVSPNVWEPVTSDAVTISTSGADVPTITAGGTVQTNRLRITPIPTASRVTVFATGARIT